MSGQVQMNPRMHHPEVPDPPRLVGQEVVGHDMDLPAPRVVDHNVIPLPVLAHSSGC